MSTRNHCRGAHIVVTTTTPCFLVRRKQGVLPNGFQKKEKENKENKYRHAFKAGQRLKLCGALLHILQGGEVLFAGADLDHAGHVVDKDLAIADVAGVQGLLGGIHHSVHADLGNNDLDLDLGQQGAVHRHAAVFLGGALLDAATPKNTDEAVTTFKECPA